MLPTEGNRSAEVVPESIQTAQFWKEREEEFRKHDIGENSTLMAMWHSTSDHWSFHAASGIGPAPRAEQVFKSLARETAKGLVELRSAEGFIKWLNALRRVKDVSTGRPAYCEVLLRGSTVFRVEELEHMVQLDQSRPPGGLVLFVLSEGSAGEPPAPGFALTGGSIETRWFWDTTIERITGLFTVSANYCLELRSRASKAPDVRETDQLTTPMTSLSPGTEHSGQLDPLAVERGGDSLRGTKPNADRWEDIEIAMISDERVEIRIGRQTETCNYHEMGFNNRKESKPNLQWAVLQVLARNQGVLSDEARNGKEWEAIEMRVGRTRKALQKYFRLTDDDPLPYVKGTGYRARFKIDRSTAADT